MKKNTLRERASYWFDGIMSRGTAALVGLLFLVTFLVVLLVAIIAFLLSPEQVGGTIGGSVWQSLMRVLDAGNVAGDYESGSWLFVLLMILATVCGLFVTSILIGIINAAFESKLTSLRKGNSRVLENGHILILGFSDHIYLLVEELISANENAKDPCIVILSGMDKEDMEENLRARLNETKNTRIICRSGCESNFADLENVAIGACKSVIVNSDDDFFIIKTVLAAATMLDKADSQAHITVVINNEDNLDAVRIAGGDKLEALYCRRTIARIIAQTCLQPGLSYVYQDLFAFEGSEIYIESAPSLVGRTFREAVLSYSNASLLGIDRGGRLMLNPAEDDGVASALAAPYAADASCFASGCAEAARSANSILVLGYNELALDMLMEVDDYVAGSSTIVVATPYSKAKDELEAAGFKNVALRLVCADIYDRAVLEGITSDDYDYIIVLSDSEGLVSDRDARTLTLLLQLRDISKKTGREFVIVSQMENVDNQKLAACAQVNDFVVGSNYVSLLTTQIAENRALSRVFEQLLTSEGSEIYIRPAARYVDPCSAPDYATLTAAALRYNELCIGYKRMLKDGSWEIRINPLKSEIVPLKEGDGLIVLAED